MSVSKKGLPYVRDGYILFLQHICVYHTWACGGMGRYDPPGGQNFSDPSMILENFSKPFSWEFWWWSWNFDPIHPHFWNRPKNRVIYLAYICFWLPISEILTDHHPGGGGGGDSPPPPPPGSENLTPPRGILLAQLWCLCIQSQAAWSYQPIRTYHDNLKYK